MKNIFLLISILLLGLSEKVNAQLEGKRYISGSAGINFSNNNPVNTSASNSFGYNFNLGLGKFRTDTRVSGWMLSNSIGGNSARYFISGAGGQQEFDKSGIKNVAVGVGKFWHFYKHFTDKLGVFGGPEINLGYVNTRDFSLVNNGQELMETKTDKIMLSLGLSAGLYYKFSEKWWVTGSLAFSNPLHVDYSIIKAKTENQDYKDKAGQLTYALSPSFTFPSVGFGLRYFYGR